MTIRSIWWVAIVVCANSSAFAQEPVPAEPAPANESAPTAAPTSAAAPTPAVPAAKADAAPSPAAATPADAAAVPLAEGKLDAEKIMAAQKAGYTIKNENGETLLCRKELQTGSRLRHKTSCLTPREWDQLQTDTAQALRAIERRKPPMGR